MKNTFDSLGTGTDDRVEKLLEKEFLLQKSPEQSAVSPRLYPAPRRAANCL